MTTWDEDGLPPELEEKIRKALPSILREFATVYSTEELATHRDLQDMLEFVSKRFETVDKRFEELISEMQRRSEIVDRRFEAVDKRFEELISEMRRGFEESDRRLEQVQENFTRMVEELGKGFEAVRKDVAAVSSRYGHRFEDIFRDIFREALLTENVDPDKLRRLYVLDEEGVVVPPGSATDIDMMVSDSECVFVEVKTRTELHDVWKFLKTVELAEKQEGVKATRLLLVTLEIDPATRLKAETLGIRVITSERDH